ncbi:MAG: CapA family protein [Candidatus Nomurabacteria bacterium]|jgi:poly-gamma-glutamate synthesis protein (capsule biosynthesis protein)|nr:CapA family protein [Candidatus Nomurabacteria bacterium]
MKKTSGFLIKNRHGRLLLTIILVIVALAALAGATYLLLRHNDNQTAPEPEEAPAKEEPKPLELSARLLFIGNIFWGRYINDWSQASELGTAYPFSGLKNFQRDQYDAWIAGLECPTVAGVNTSSAAQEDTLTFNCRPEYLPEAAKWFSAVTLANNHTDNQGLEGFEETKTQLDEAGIQYFGHYDPEKLDEVCNIVTIPAHLQYDDGNYQKIELPLVFCGYHGVFKVPSSESLALITKYSQNFPVFALPHMGAEYQPAPDDIKTATYRAMLDNGAEMVIGDHPHWVQNTEVYKNKLIIYSMGNFMFDQQFNSEVTRSAAIDVTVSGDGAAAQAWAALADDCRGDLPKCLELATEKQLPKLKLNYKFDVKGSDDSNHLTKPATKSQLDSIKQRLNWASTLSKLEN